MNSFEYYLTYLNSGSIELEAYLLSNELFWPISAVPPGGAPAFPKLNFRGVAVF